MTNPTAANIDAAPVARQYRIIIPDSLCDIAILSILLMNIPDFGLPEPVCYGDFSVLHETGLNLKVWFGVDWFLEGSQRALFSMLFGAGILLFISRQEKKTAEVMPAEYFFRRQLWLLVFGLINGFVLLWFWDILFHYAICGMILFAFRRLSPKAMIIAAIVCLVFQTASENIEYYRTKKMITTGEMIAKMYTTQTKLTEVQKEQLGVLTGFKEKTSLEDKIKTMEKSLKKVRGNYAGLYKHQSERTYYGEIHYTYEGLWDILIFIFLGMAFYKNDVLLGTASVKVYWALFIRGLSIGLILSWFRLKPLIDFNYNYYEKTKQVKFKYYEISRTFRAVGILGLIIFCTNLFGLNGCL